MRVNNADVIFVDGKTNLSICQFQLCGQLFSIFGRKIFMVGESTFQTLRLLRRESHLTTFPFETTSR